MRWTAQIPERENRFLTLEAWPCNVNPRFRYRWCKYRKWFILAASACTDMVFHRCADSPCPFLNWGTYSSSYIDPSSQRRCYRKWISRRSTAGVAAAVAGHNFFWRLMSRHAGIHNDVYAIYSLYWKNIYTYVSIWLLDSSILELFSIQFSPTTGRLVVSTTCILRLARGVGSGQTTLQHAQAIGAIFGDNVFSQLFA